MKNWHVAFNVEPRESGNILITGFEKGWNPGEGILIPDWVKFNSGWWAEGEIDDRNFVRRLEFMIQEDIIKISDSETTDDTTYVPQWVRYNAHFGGQMILLMMKHL